MKAWYKIVLSVIALAGANQAWSAPAARTVPACTNQSVSATIVVAANTTYDGVAKFGKWMCFVGSTTNMNGTQSESQIPVFRLEDGAVLKNVVIGDGAKGSGTDLAAGGADGVHCYGRCTISNVYWADVGEDAATLRKVSGITSSLTISGGAAFKAADKVFQHNGDGTMTITNFYANNIGKLYRSCGNCSTQYARKVNVTSVTLGTVNSSGVGVNSSYTSGPVGQYDVATFSDFSYSGSKTKCQAYVGNNTGAEPPKDTNATNIARSCVFK